MLATPRARPEGKIVEHSSILFSKALNFFAATINTYSIKMQKTK
jgi:hypothetical protein